MRVRFVLVAISALGAAQAWAGDLVDTRITWVFCDDNVLARSGQTTPNSPDAFIGCSAAAKQFFDNFNTRYSGFENISNLVIHAQAPTFFAGLTAEAALAVTVTLSQLNSDASKWFSDTSSYVRLHWTPAGWDAKTAGLNLTLFPVSADRFRLGFAYKVSWGGSPIFAKKGNVPGLRLQFTAGPVYAFLGLKTTLQAYPAPPNNNIEEETYYGTLAGAGIDVLPTLRFEVNGGYFTQGKFEFPDVIGTPVRAAGVSAQAVYHLGEPVPISLDFKLYKNLPDAAEVYFKPEPYPGGVSLVAIVEGSYLAHNLKDPGAPGGTRIQSAYAVALQGRVKSDFARLHLLALKRSLSFIQFNVPGFPPFLDFPAGTQVDDEQFFAVGADYYVAPAHLTVGILGGFQRPASFTGDLRASGLCGNNPPPGCEGSRTVVIRDENLFSILPSGLGAVNIFSVKGTVRWDIADFMAFIGELYYTRDENRFTFAEDVTGVNVYEPVSELPAALGFNAAVQARF